MQQYFSADPACESRPVSYTFEWKGRSFSFKTDSGVFSKGETDFGTELLLNALPPLTGRTLDLGCGFGVIGVCLAAVYPVDMVMCDVNRRAVALAEENARSNGVTAQALESDGLTRVEGQFSQIVTNPPIRAGKQVIYSLFAQAHERLLPGGRLFLVIRRQQGAESAARYLSTLFSQVDTLERKKGFYVFACTKN